VMRARGCNSTQRQKRGAAFSWLRGKKPSKPLGAPRETMHRVPKAFPFAFDFIAPQAGYAGPRPGK